MTSEILNANTDQLALTGKALSEAQTEAQVLLANTLRAAALAAPGIRGAASAPWAALLDEWQTQAEAHKTQGEKLADGTTNAAQGYAATDGAQRFVSIADELALDGIHDPTVALGPTIDQVGGTPATPDQQHFDGSNLWATSGPSEEDVHQTGIGDCYFDASMAAVAYAQPGILTKDITYDPKTDTFQVQLYDYPDGRDWVDGTHLDGQPWAPGQPITPKTITVTQADILSDIKNTGASSLDDGKKGYVWPAVMEAAYAKMLDGEYGNTVYAGGSSTYDETYHDPVTAGLQISGSTNAHDSSRGGADVDQGMASITGHTGTWAAPSLDSYDAIKAALANHQPVTMGTTGAPGGDREFEDQLAHSHVYTVEGITKDAGGNVQITVRNPWGNNDFIPGVAHPETGVITVNLGKELGDHVVASFDLGPDAER